MNSKNSNIAVILILIILTIFAGCVEKRSQETASRPVQPRQSDLLAGNYLPDIETFMQIGYVANADISQDGRRIFFSPSYTNAMQLFRITDNQQPYQLTSFEDGISWYVLSHDAYYAIVGAANGGDENAQLYLLDTESGRIRKLTDNPETRFGEPIWSIDDKTIYFYSNLENGKDFMIYKMDLPDGKVELVYAKPGYNGTVEISDDGKYLLIYSYYSSRNNDFFIYNLETGEEECLTPHEGDFLYLTVNLNEDYTKAYITTNNTPDGITRLGVLDVATKEIIFLDPDQKWECEGASLSENGKYLAWLLNMDGYSQPFLKDLEKDMMLPVPDLKGMFTLGGITADGNFLFSFNNANNAPNLWLWSPAKNELRKITDVSTLGIDVTKFVEPELIHYKSFDRLEIPAFLYLPPDYKGGPIPFIIDIHGGPEGQYRPYFSRHFNFLLSHGFGLMAPNVRGSEGYGKDYLDMDNYKNRMNSVKDAAEAANWLIDKGYTSAEMLGVKGTSYGGYMVMALVTEYPDLFAAGWDQVGIVNFETYLENTADYRRALRESEYGPLSDREFLRSISPIHKVDRIKCPLMIVHGENDPRVPIGEARQIIRQLKDLGGIVDSLIFPDEGHGIAKLENRLTSYRKMADFFRKHLN